MLGHALAFSGFDAAATPDVKHRANFPARYTLRPLAIAVNNPVATL